MRELAAQIEELQWLIQRPHEPYRIIPVIHVPIGLEREHILEVLTKLSVSVRDMCAACNLELDAIDADHKLRSIAEYLKATIKNVKPEHLRGYGLIQQEDQRIINTHIDKFLASLKEL